MKKESGEWIEVSRIFSIRERVQMDRSLYLGRRERGWDVKIEDGEEGRKLT